MNIGRLDRQITIQRKTTAKDSYGAEVKTWADVLTCWATFTPVQAAERFEAARTIAARAGKFMIRWRDNVTALDRISFDGLTWEITGVAEFGRREGLELTAEALLV